MAERVEIPEPERFKDKARNVLLNVAVIDLHRIIDGHDPETDTTLKNMVWDRLDKLAMGIEARATAELTALREREAVLREALETIRDFPKPGYPRRDDEGYPMEIVYDDFAYRRIIDTYRGVARDALDAALTSEGQ